MHPRLDGERVYDERELLLGPVLLRERPPLWRDLCGTAGTPAPWRYLIHGTGQNARDGNQLVLYRRELSYVRQELEKFH